MLTKCYQNIVLKLNVIFVYAMNLIVNQVLVEILINV